MIPLFATAHAADPVIDALAAELARTPQLALPNESPPYFVAYRLLDVDHVSVEATLGGVVSERAAADRDLGVQVRAGSPAEDNTNFRHGSDATGLSSTSLVIGDSESAVRQQAWLATDREYKNAVENLARKRSARRNQPPRERPADFAPSPPHTADAPAAEAPEPAALRDLAVTLSARFLDHPDPSGAGCGSRRRRAAARCWTPGGRRWWLQCRSSTSGWWPAPAATTARRSVTTSPT